MISVSEFAKRAGVARNSIYKAIRAGRVIKTDDGIDETDPTNADYLSGSNPSVPRQVAPNQRPQSQNQNKSQNIPVDINRAAIDAEKAKQQAIHWQLKNQRQRGLLIDRELVNKGIEITDTEHHRLLADGSETIAKTAMNLTKAGAEKEEIIEAVRNEISNSLKAWKVKMSRTLKMFYDE